MIHFSSYQIPSNVWLIQSAVELIQPSSCQLNPQLLIDLAICVSMFCSYFFGVMCVFKVLYIFLYLFLFYPYNFNIFVYPCRVHIIIHVVSYFSYFLCRIQFLSYNHVISNIIKNQYILIRFPFFLWHGESTSRGL